MTAIIPDRPPMPRPVLRLLAFLLLCCGLSSAQDRASIVLIVSDDQGYGDVSCHPHPDEVSTPNIDRIASEGARMTNGYASCPVCAPTRAGLLTGRYQQRFRVLHRLGLACRAANLGNHTRRTAAGRGLRDGRVRQVASRLPAPVQTTPAGLRDVLRIPGPRGTRLLRPVGYGRGPVDLPQLRSGR